MNGAARQLIQAHGYLLQSLDACGIARAREDCDTFREEQRRFCPVDTQERERLGPSFLIWG